MSNNEGETNEAASGNNGAIEVTSPGLPAKLQQRSKRQSELKPTKVIAGGVRGVFDARILDIENFHHLICQRVRDQADCESEDTEVAVYLSNGTSRRFPSIDEFKGYVETGDPVPTVVNLEISLGIKFHGTNRIERQNVDIAIRASDISADTIEHQNSQESLRFATDKMQIAILSSESDLGIFSYTIDHTRISWGLDVENLIRSHIAKLIQPLSWSDKVLRFIKDPLHLVTTILVGLVVANQFVDLLFRFLFETEGAPEGTSIVDVASNWLVNGHMAKYIVVSLIVSVVIMTLTSSLVRNLLKNLSKPRPSFILLSEFDEKRRGTRLSNHEKRWTRVGVTLALNLVAVLATIMLEDRILTYWNSI